jgi:hypothetical protein
MRKSISRKRGRDEEATATRRAFIPMTMADNHFILQGTLPIFFIHLSACTGVQCSSPLLSMPCWSLWANVGTLCGNLPRIERSNESYMHEVTSMTFIITSLLCIKKFRAAALAMGI